MPPHAQREQTAILFLLISLGAPARERLSAKRFVSSSFPHGSRVWHTRTPALCNAQARALLNPPPADTITVKRDRAVLATLRYHGLRREERCKLRVQDVQQRKGVLWFKTYLQPCSSDLRANRLFRCAMLFLPSECVVYKHPQIKIAIVP